LLRAFQQYVPCHLHTRIQGNSRLLVVENQIVNLTFGPSFGHNLCFNYSNGPCEPILNIYVPRPSNDIKNYSMGFDAYNHSLKIWKSIKTPTPKVGAHLGVWRFIPSHFPTLPGAWNVIPAFPSWPLPLQILALVVSPKLELWHFSNHNLCLRSKNYVL
jgi:hypothetical protein